MNMLCLQVSVCFGVGMSQCTIIYHNTSATVFYYVAHYITFTAFILEVHSSELTWKTNMTDKITVFGMEHSVVLYESGTCLPYIPKSSNLQSLS